MSGPGQATLHLKVITPARLLAEADVEAVFLPSLEGEIGVLPGHRPLFVGIGTGRLRFQSGGEEESFVVKGGYAQVQPEKVLVMTDAGEDDEDVEGGAEAA
jgi:F-type H+-transporting ATPase subunit epsilon